jgi:hypothetical protein
MHLAPGQAHLSSWTDRRGSFLTFTRWTPAMIAEFERKNPGHIDELKTLANLGNPPQFMAGADSGLLYHVERAYVDICSGKTRASYVAARGGDMQRKHQYLVEIVSADVDGSWYTATYARPAGRPPDPSAEHSILSLCP